MIKPRAPQPHNLAKSAVIEYRHFDIGGDFYLALFADGVMVRRIRFDSAAERKAAHDDMLHMMRSSGAVDIPNRPQ